MIAEMKIGEMKKAIALSDFPIFQQKVLGKRLVYLDNAATTQKPHVVIDAMTHFYEHSNANIHRGIHTLSERATVAYENARETVARFIGAETEEIIFTSGTTQSLNMLSQMLGKNLHRGDEIVLTIMEHHSNLIPWQELAREKGIVLQFIPLTSDYVLDLKKARELITEKTKVVAVTHVSNALGTINPVAEIAAMAHRVGALVVVDAAQSVGHLPVDVRQLNCDFLAFSGHKMCGPTGIGVLYGKKELLDYLNPVIFGGGMVLEVDTEKATWTTTPQKFEAGTPNIVGAIGLAKAVEYLTEVGMERVEEQSMVIANYARQKLSEIHGLIIIGPQSQSKSNGGDSKSKNGSIISFTLDGVHPHDAAEILNKKGIAVRAGRHCTTPLMNELHLNGTIRASFYFYNSTEDVDALVAGLKAVQEVFQ